MRGDVAIRASREDPPCSSSCLQYTDGLVHEPMLQEKAGLSFDFG